MTTVKSINLYVRPEKIQKERYDKLQERMQKPTVSVKPDLRTDDQRIGDQLDLFAKED
jgi:hypothetical protein